VEKIKSEITLADRSNREMTARLDLLSKAEREIVKVRILLI
jgi:hypothetical protein